MMTEAEFEEYRRPLEYGHGLVSVAEAAVSTWNLAIPALFAASPAWTTLLRELRDGYDEAVATAVAAELQRALVQQLRYGETEAEWDIFYPRGDAAMTERMLAEAIRGISMHTFGEAVGVAEMQSDDGVCAGAAAAERASSASMRANCSALYELACEQTLASTIAHGIVFERVMRQNTMQSPPPYHTSVVVPATSAGRRGQRPDFPIGIWFVEKIIWLRRFGLPASELQRQVSASLNAMHPGERVSWLELRPGESVRGAVHSQQQGPPVYMRLDTGSVSGDTVTARPCVATLLTVALQWGNDQKRELFSGLYHCETGHRSFLVQNGGAFARKLDDMLSKASAGRHADTTPSINKIRHMVFCSLAEQWQSAM
jgi:hypothetical protein